MAAGSSTLPNNETVTLKLPSGEMVDAVVPAGYSDAQVKLLMQMKRPDLIAPPGVPRPQVNMQQSALGATDYSDPSIPKFGGMHGGSYDIAPRDPQGQISPDTIKAGAIGGTAGAALSPVAIPASGNLAKNLPGYLAGAAGGAAINYARKTIPGGQYIPAGAEILPFLMMGGKSEGSKAVAKEEAGTAAAQTAEEAEAAGTRVPVGKLAKEVPNPDPYKFKGAPDSMDIVQSTNVGKVGYEPDSRTMTVEYKNGLVYSYHGVPQEIYSQAKDAESIGSYISRNVKGRYETVRRGSVLVKKR